LVQIPYVNASKEVRNGTLVSTLTLAGDVTAAPDTHVMHFAGDQPCNRDGTEISSIKHSTGRATMGGVTIERSFSNKPPNGYKDYYEKVRRYADIISAPAKALDPAASVTPLAARAPDDSVFEYLDNATSRVGIGEASKKLELAAVAVVGLGGTGSYVLDFVAKTPVKQIHLFDGDVYLQHNAFRAPGAASIEDLRAKPKKVDYFYQTYSKMHRGIVRHPYDVDASNVTELRDMAFVFLCMDPGPAKRAIVEFLEREDKPFVDVGMGLSLVDGAITGLVRTTASTQLRRDHLRVKARVSFAEEEDGEYATNIQLADLNALNAVLAVIKWKKTLGFYHDLEKEHFTVYSLATNALLNEDNP
jgi:tRNA A37 threonylcarbamoyladenosine dehydratase